MSDELDITFGSMQSKSKSYKVKEFMNLLQRMTFGSNHRNHFCHQVQEAITEDDAQLWLELEEQWDVQVPLVKDDFDTLARQPGDSSKNLDHDDISNDDIDSNKESQTKSLYHPDQLLWDC